MKNLRADSVHPSIYQRPIEEESAVESAIVKQLPTKKYSGKRPLKLEMDIY